ncbi:hypothetical protein [Actinocorallia longicatena]|uniref:hypothetical protein n=1 Tax=Actinocorallia longicatena TaxID=111803 RepID=UPI0031D682EF
MGSLVGAALAPRIARRFGTARGRRLTLLAALPFALVMPLAGAGWMPGCRPGAVCWCPWARRSACGRRSGWWPRPMPSRPWFCS